MPEWLPSAADPALVSSVIGRVVEPGKMAAWIATPQSGINSVEVFVPLPAVLEASAPTMPAAAVALARSTAPSAVTVSAMPPNPFLSAAPVPAASSAYERQPDHATVENPAIAAGG